MRTLVVLFKLMLLPLAAVAQVEAPNAPRLTPAVEAQIVTAYAHRDSASEVCLYGHMMGAHAVATSAQFVRTPKDECALTSDSIIGGMHMMDSAAYEADSLGAWATARTILANNPRLRVFILLYSGSGDIVWFLQSAQHSEPREERQT